MAQTTCPKCGGGAFELQTAEPQGSTFILNFVQCSQCGAPVGVTEYHNIGAVLERVEALIDQIGGRMDEVERAVKKIAKQ